jgi:hypothetical protein
MASFFPGFLNFFPENIDFFSGSLGFLERNLSGPARSWQGSGGKLAKIWREVGKRRRETARFAPFFVQNTVFI